MADNVAITAGSGTNVACDEATYSGDTTQIQVIHPVLVSGSEGAKTVAEIYKAEDSAHSSGDVGLQALAVRKATTPTDRSAGATDGDYEPLQVDGNGRLYSNASIYTPAGDTAMDDTANAVKTLAVDSSGNALATAVDRLTDNIGIAHQTDVILSDTTALTPKFKYAAVAASQTDSSLIAAVASKKLRVLSMVVQVGGTATDSTFESDGGSDTAIHKVTAGANGGQVLGFNPVGWFETLSGEALIVTTGAGSTTQYTITYVEV